jgi:glucose-6-phosphate dehydrogenase assembly protein OpcA
MNSLTQPIPAVCPELGIEVSIASIDGELRKLWEQDEARTNASLMNLVVYSEKPGALLENSAIIRDLTREHACRAILVGIDRAEPEPSLRAWITAHCHLADGRKSVCCEQIAFHLTGRVTGRFRNTVFAHLNSDLPLVFWWQGELSEILTERLVSVMDRLVIDSSSWVNPAASFAMIEEASQANPDLVIQDHAWTRSWQFRVGIASLFDDPAAQQALPEIHSVEIVHHPDHRNSALQILAWLAVQAGWKDHLSDGALAFESSAGLVISVVLRAETASPPLAAVMICAGATTVQVTQKVDSSHVERHVESAAYRATSLSPIDPVTPAELVAIQLARGGRNSLYQKILPRFRKMLGK